MSKYTLNQPIWYIQIRKYKDDRNKYSFRQDGVEVENLQILGISKYKIVLNNDWFTSLDNEDRENYRKDKSVYHYLDEISVNVRVNSILDEGVFISLYSTVAPTKKILNKMVAKASVVIDKQYGFLYRGVVQELETLIDNYENKTA